MDGKARIYSFRQLVDLICLETYRTLLTGTFIEGSSYIEGFAKGLAVGDPSLGTKWVTGSGITMATEWLDFTREWLPKRLKFARNACWQAAMMRKYPDDKMALEQLHSLYLEYVAERDAKE